VLPDVNRAIYTPITKYTPSSRQLDLIIDLSDVIYHGVIIRKSKSFTAQPKPRLTDAPTQRKSRLC
jgi:hypothetical protein